MKTKLFLILAVIIISCKPPVIVPPEEIPPVVIETPVTDPVPVDPVPVVPVVPVPNVRIYNSAWEIVQEGYVEKSRSVTTIQSYADYVAEYNAKTLDDQMFIVEGEEIIPIEDAPPADAYIADPMTHDIIKQYIDWPRADLVDRREIWRMQAMADGGVLYVDQVPPPPVPIVDDRPAFEKYSLYLIYTDTGIIKYEEHLETEAAFLERLAVYQTQVAADGGTTYIVSGRLYP